MIEIYTMIGVIVFAAGIYGYVKWLESRNKTLKAELEASNVSVGIAKAETAQLHKTEAKVAQVEQKLQKDYQAQQARIESGAPRDQFDSEEF